MPMMVGMSPSITLHGIPNCDTVKKARAWLTDHHVEHQFHDFKKQGVPQPDIDRWLDAVGWEKLLNRKGTMWRKLTPEQQAGVDRRAFGPRADAGGALGHQAPGDGLGQRPLHRGL